MDRRIGLLGLVAACGGSTVKAPAGTGRAEPSDRTYYAIVGLPKQSFASPMLGGDVLKRGDAWIAIEQAPYAVVSASDGRVELLSPLEGPSIPKLESWDEPMGTVRQHLFPGERRQVEATYRLALDTLASDDRATGRAAKLIVSLDPFQACDPLEDGIAKQIEVRQHGCFLETERCKDVRTLAVQQDGTYVIGPLRASVAVVCLSVAHEL
jgi:hypothetical protein